MRRDRHLRRPEQSLQGQIPQASKGIVVLPRVGPVILIEPHHQCWMVWMHVPFHRQRIKILERFVGLAQCHPLEERAYQHLIRISVPVGIVRPRANVKKGR